VRRRIVLRVVTAALAVTSAAPRANLAAQSGDVLIPFTIGPRDCVDRNRLYTVSMRIHNVLAQPVGLPTLVAESREQPPAGGGRPAESRNERPLSNLRLPCGRYLARWTGRHLTTGRRLPPGVYLTELVIDGQRISRKVTLDR
jgi:hypothetical protein